MCAIVKNWYILLWAVLQCQFAFGQDNNFLTVTGTVTDESTRQPIAGALIVVTSNANMNRLRIATDDAGRYQINLQHNQSYLITATHKEYFTQAAVKINTFDNNLLIELPFSLKKIVKDTPYRIDSIYFEVASDSLLPASLGALQQLQLLLSLNNRMEVEIAVHTDARGDDDFNQELSQRRAERIAEYLINNSIDSKRLIAKGYGETRLLNHCRNEVKCTNAEHLVNRRVELIIKNY